VKDKLQKEETERQWYEAVWVTINDKTYQFKLDYRSNPHEQVTIPLPKAGNYKYSLHVQTYWYSSKDEKCKYEDKPKVGKGAATAQAKKDANFRLFVDNKPNPDGTEHMYLEADK